MKKMAVLTGFFLVFPCFSMENVTELRGIAEEYLQYGDIYWESSFALEKGLASSERFKKIDRYLENVYKAIDQVLNFLSFGNSHTGKVTISDKVETIFKLAQNEVKNKQQYPSTQQFYLITQKSGKFIQGIYHEIGIRKKVERKKVELKQLKSKKFGSILDRITEQRGIITQEDIPWFTGTICNNSIRAIILKENVDPFFEKELDRHGKHRRPFALTVLFQVYFELFLEKGIISSRLSSDGEANYLDKIRRLALAIEEVVKKNNILIPYIQNAFSFFGTHPDINDVQHDNLEKLRAVLLGVGWMKPESEDRYNARMQESEPRRVENIVQQEELPQEGELQRGGENQNPEGLVVPVEQVQQPVIERVVESISENVPENGDQPIQGEVGYNEPRQESERRQNDQPVGENELLIPRGIQRGEKSRWEKIKEQITVSRALGFATLTMVIYFMYQKYYRK